MNNNYLVYSVFNYQLSIINYSCSTRAIPMNTDESMVNT